MEKKIGFKDLHWACKVGIVGGWVVLMEYVILFIYGYVIGLGV